MNAPPISVFLGAAGEPPPPRVSPLSPYLRPGDGVLDLGANVGEYTRDFAERVGPTGCVLAVEPDPFMAMICQLIAKKHPQVQVIPAAVAEACGLVRLHCDAHNSRRNSLYRANLTDDSQRTRLVPSVTLDALAAQVSNLKAIKADLQGAEMAMLLGGRATLQRFDLVWYVEIWGAGLTAAGATAVSLALDFDLHGWHPVGTTWSAVVAAAADDAVQNVLLRHVSKAA